MGDRFYNPLLKGYRVTCAKCGTVHGSLLGCPATAPADAGVSCASVGHVVVGHVTLPCGAPDCPYPAPADALQYDPGEVRFRANPADAGGEAGTAKRQDLNTRHIPPTDAGGEVEADSPLSGGSCPECESPLYSLPGDREECPECETVVLHGPALTPPAGEVPRHCGHRWGTDCTYRGWNGYAYTRGVRHLCVLSLGHEGTCCCMCAQRAELPPPVGEVEGEQADEGEGPSYAALSAAVARLRCLVQREGSHYPEALDTVCSALRAADAAQQAVGALEDELDAARDAACIIAEQEGRYRAERDAAVEQLVRERAEHLSIEAALLDERDALAAQAREAEGLRAEVEAAGLDAKRETRARLDQERRTMNAVDDVRRLVRVIADAHGGAASLLKAEALNHGTCLLWREDGERMVREIAQERDALRARVAELEGEMESARRAMEKNATRLDRVSTYAIKHGPDVSVTKALAGICEDLTVHAIRLANVSARAEAAGGE